MQRKKGCKIIYLFSVLMMVTTISFSGMAAMCFTTPEEELYNTELIDVDEIDTRVKKVMKRSGTKGTSVVIVSEDTTIYRSYGYADESKGIPVKEETLFELGSNSKAFTALGILYLEEKELLSLKDPVKKYLPWLDVKFKGYYGGRSIEAEVELSIEDLLYHTSGIPFRTIGMIPQGETDDMLEKTVSILDGIGLDFYPGARYSYATINYAVLGLIIQNISGLSYEEFMKENILAPLGLDDTYVFRPEAVDTGRMSKGYKFSFFSPKEYRAPVYRGNTPGGYFISSPADMERWLRIQMGLVEIPEFYKRLVERSHRGNTKVPSFGDYYYGGGWLVRIRGDEIKHGGSNPTFSSAVIVKPEQKLGICVLSNLNSNSAEYLAANILKMIEGKTVDKYKTDSYKSLDTVFSLITIGAIVFGVLFFLLTIMAVREIIAGKRKRVKINGGKLAGIFPAMPIMIFFGYCLYYLPNILLYRLSWDAVTVWASPFIYRGCFCGFCAGVVFLLYVLVTLNYPKKNEKGYLALAPLSIINGFMSALIIFTINESFNRNLEYSRELLVYFAFSLLFFVYSMKLLQGKLILLTNEITYEKRMKMIGKIMNSSFQSIERIGSQRIYSGLNNDPAAISQLPGLVVRVVSDTLTLVFCLGFLLSKSIYAFLASVSIIVLNGFISFLTSRIARKHWEKNRDIQDTFFGQISDLVKGFKELVLNKLRKKEFYLDIKKFARLSTELNKAASIKVLNFNMYNVLMYNIVFGVVVFIFPMLMANINVNELRENLFIVFYMIGPFSNIAGAIPQLTSVRVNLRRINLLNKDLDDITKSDLIDMDEIKLLRNEDIHIRFSDVEFTYLIPEKEGEMAGEFRLGPLNLEFKTGEITFITGGNGSGKSTLAKLITGLYAPDKGSVFINGHLAGLQELNHYFTSIFTDFHLFSKLYGINYTEKNKQLVALLERMRIHDKVKVNGDGEFSSVDLSTGQRKRLAFIISCLEEKPMMLFDEWAAEQDPEFKRYFYSELLPLLKRNGKGVIVVTHDDRYFNIADKLIKLERGTIVEEDAEEVYA